jgi:hypothetical protein
MNLSIKDYQIQNNQESKGKSPDLKFKTGITLQSSSNK